MLEWFYKIGRPLLDALKRTNSACGDKRYPLHNNEGFAPFFIIGAGRSGNTLMRRILQASPEVHIPPETYVLGSAIRAFSRNALSPWSDLVHLVYSILEYDPNFEVFEISLRPLAQKMARSPSETRSLAFLLHGFYTFHGNQTGQTFKRWGDKTPLNTFCLNEILSVFPDARFVNMVRDGADVAHSYVAADLQPNLEAAAERWVSSIIAAANFASSNPGKLMDVRYEDLVSDPGRVTQDVCGFLSLEYRDNLLKITSHLASMPDVSSYNHYQRIKEPITSNYIGAGRDSLSPDEKRYLQGKIGNELKILGYQTLV